MLSPDIAPVRGSATKGSLVAAASTLLAAMRADGPVSPIRGRAPLPRDRHLLVWGAPDLPAPRGAGPADERYRGHQATAGRA